MRNKIVSLLIGVLILNISQGFLHFYRNSVRLSQFIKHVPDLVAYHGYPIETHRIITLDGYAIELHRIPYTKSTRDIKNKPIVLLSQCFLCSSAQWVVLGAKKSLAYMLANKGYDVWLLNTRGNSYSSKHILLSTKSSKFWDFSWHEMATLDVPATIDYILDIRNQTQLDYVGYSMGTTLYFVLMSEMPEYRHKVRRMVALAPVAYGTHTEGFIAKTSNHIHLYEKVAEDLGLREIPPDEYRLRDLLSSICEPGNIFLTPFCKSILHTFARASDRNIDMENVDLFFRFYPDTVSLRTLTHFFQIRNSGNFQQYDFGEWGNYANYGAATPPLYNLSRVVTPMAFFWAKSDPLSTYKDMLRLRAQLPNIVLDHEITEPEFTHGDFVWGRDADKIVYEKVIEFLQS